MYVIHTDWCDIYCLTGVIYLRLCSGAERRAFEGKVVSTLEALMESMNQLKGNPSITQTEVGVWCNIVCSGCMYWWLIVLVWLFVYTLCGSVFV